MITIAVGLWALPLLVTAVAFGWVIVPRPGEENRGGDYSFPNPLPAIRLVGALILSLVAWLIWALVA